MNLYKMNFEHMSHQVLKDATNYIPTDITNGTTFLHQAMVIFASVPLKRSQETNLYSISETLSQLPNTIVTPNGELTPANYVALLKFVANIPRSRLVNSMTKNPTLGSLTPIFMYAHKLYNDVDYGEWDKNDPNIYFALGKFLSDAYDAYKITGVESIECGIAELRAEALTYRTGKKAGEMEKLTAYKMPKKIECGPETYLIKPYTFLALQTWLANAEIRNEKTMLLDMEDWGNIPAPLDAVIVAPDREPSTTGLRNDLAWDTRSLGSK